LGVPDPEAHHLPVNLTKLQIEQSPDVDTSVPLPQNSVTEACDHDDLPHGRDHFIWGGHEGKPSDLADAETRTRLENPAGSELKTAPQDVRLRRISATKGDTVQATDGHIGHAEDFLIDTALWQVRYLVVHTSIWWTGQKLLVSPLSVAWIDWARCVIHLDVSRQKVKDSPPYAAAQTVDGAFEELFYSHYGIRGARR
jgi:hypothetical protein